MHYLALGDSISIDDYTGVVEGGAVKQFARLIHASSLENLTRDGRMTDGVIESLQSVTTRPDIVTVTAGGNDLMQATFRETPPADAPHDHWLQLAEPALANLRRIAAHLTTFQCPVIINTIYDPTDRDDSLSAEMGMPPEARQTFDAINAGIKAIAQEHGFLLSDLEALFKGHGLNARESWIVMNIEPNYEGATAIATHWHQLYRSHQK